VSTALLALTLAAAVGAGTTGGVFFGFPALVMPALARLSAAGGIAAMQSINTAAVRPTFMTALFGTGAACVPLTVAAFRTWGDRPAFLLAVGSTLFLVGTVGLTAVRHVPLNEALAAVDPHAALAEKHWRNYLRRWTTANHLRTASALGATAAFALALPF
jgi:uncharacterized membrane protein